MISEGILRALFRRDFLGELALLWLKSFQVWPQTSACSLAGKGYISTFHDESVPVSMYFPSQFPLISFPYTLYKRSRNITLITVPVVKPPEPTPRVL